MRFFADLKYADSMKAEVVIFKCSSGEVVVKLDLKCLEGVGEEED